MAHRRGRSAVQTMALVLLCVLVVRLAFDLVELVCRALVFVLVRACWLLEAGVDQLAAAVDTPGWRTTAPLSASEAWEAENRRRELLSVSNLGDAELRRLLLSRPR